MKLVLGLDLGVASIGWALLQKNDNDEFTRIIDLGSRVFNQLQDGKSGKLENLERRNKRSMRRQRRRKVRRLEELRTLMKNEFGIDFKDCLTKVQESPYELKVRGLNEQISIEELMICLYHYMKYRGFKSSRKVNDVKAEGVLLDKIEDVRSKLSDSTTITQYLLNKFNSTDKTERRIHNSDKEYHLTVSRDMYLDEINKLFAVQSKWYDLNTFKTKYLDLYNRQRDFSEGPGQGSPFGAKNGQSLIERMIGICTFDGKPRAPKDSYSAQAFVLLSFLNNIQYKMNAEDKYHGLTSDEISLIFEKAKVQKKVSYTNVFKSIGKEDFYKIKGVDLSRKEYLNRLKKYKEVNSISGNLSAEDFAKFNEEATKYLYDKELNVSMSSYHEMKKAFLGIVKKDKNQKELVDEFIENEGNFDDIAQILLRTKTDEGIKAECHAKGYPDCIIDAILTLPEFKQTINLSLDICKQIIPHLLSGCTYDKAMINTGYNHTTAKTFTKYEYLPEIDEAMGLIDEQLTNPTVRHTLVYMRQIINAIIKRYGTIDEYHIELARELKRNFEDRKKIKYDMIDNQNNNLDVKHFILNKYPHLFKSIYQINRNDVIKYKLFVEQNGVSAYTNKPISEGDIFNDNLYQIDHIIPYSRSFDDSYDNKVLVETHENQIKKNMTPMEAFSSDKEKMEKIYSFLSNASISLSKKERILSKSIDDDFKNRNLNDTSYIAKLAKKLIFSLLQPQVCICPAGKITDKLKSIWGLKGYTHSYINPTLRNDLTYVFKNYELKSKSIEIEFYIKETEQTNTLIIEYAKAQKNKELPLEKEQLNEALNFFIKSPSLFDNVFRKFIDKDFDVLVESINTEFADVNNQRLRENANIIVIEMLKTISNDKMTKNRDNDLHHALDAAVIAATSQGMIQQITKYYQNKENNKVVNEETGEVGFNSKYAPSPYNGYREELILRVYERDKDKLLSKLNELPQYKNNQLERRDVHVLLPVRLPEKYNAGAFHKDTIFGYKNGCITKRIGVDKLDDGKIEKIMDGGAGAKPVVEACKEWLKMDADYKKNHPYPIHPATGNPIKSVCIIETEDSKSRIQLGDKKFATNAECIRVDVYKKENDDKLYFVPIYYYQIKTEETNKKRKIKKDVYYEIMWGQGNNSDYVTSAKLNNEFKCIAKLPRYSLIEIELKDGSNGLCYSGGATSGMFEVYSILGDQLDLKHNGIGRIADRNQKTVSQIKSIKVRSISILGQLN